MIEDDPACDFESGWSLVTYGSLNGDLNQASGGKDLFLCQNPAKMKAAGIVGLRLTENLTSCINNTAGRPVPHVSSLNGDLNQGSGGKYIYLCYQLGADSKEKTTEKVTHLGLAEESCKSPYTKVVDPDGKLNGDLNEGSKGKYIFLCESTTPLEETLLPSGFKIQDSSSCSEGKIVKSTSLNGDVNQKSGGKDIFLCMTTKNAEFTDLKLVDNAKKCPVSYTLVPHVPQLNGDLNQESGGKDIFLCYINEKDKSQISDLTVN